jgi:5-methylcytosine-specific restriction endonuclease McrA
VLKNDTINMNNIYCKKCGKVLTGKQTSYCSEKCSKLFLKSLYRKRNKEKIREYNKKYKEQCKFKPIKNPGKIIIRDGLKCQNCETPINLEVHHIKPLRVGGSNVGHNLITLCKKCHYDFETRLKGFWKC